MELLAVGNVCRTQIEHKVYGEVVKTINSLDYTIVKIRLFRSGDKSVLQFLLEKSNGEPVSINDCETASKAIAAILDVKDDFIDTSYNLEVMSAGINRPLTRPEDFERFTGQRARVKLVQKIDGIGVFYGEISKFDGKVVVLNQEKSSVAIEFSNISDAALDLIEREERFKEDKKSPEYQQKFKDKRVSERKFGSNRSSNDRGPRRTFNSDRSFDSRSTEASEGNKYRRGRTASEGGEKRFGPRREDDNRGSDRPRRPFSSGRQASEGGERRFNPRREDDNRGSDRPRRAFSSGRPASEGGEKRFGPRREDDNRGSDRPRRAFSSGRQASEGGERRFSPRREDNNRGSDRSRRAFSSGRPATSRRFGSSDKRRKDK